MSPDPTTITIPADLKPADGRFGAGPSKVRPEQVAARRGLPLEDVAPAALLRAQAAGTGA